MPYTAGMVNPFYRGGGQGKRQTADAAQPTPTPRPTPPVPARPTTLPQAVTASVPIGPFDPHAADEEDVLANVLRLFGPQAAGLQVYYRLTRTSSSLRVTVCDACGNELNVLPQHEALLFELYAQIEQHFTQGSWDLRAVTDASRSG